MVMLLQSGCLATHLHLWWVAKGPEIIICNPPWWLLRKSMRVGKVTNSAERTPHLLPSTLGLKILLKILTAAGKQWQVECFICAGGLVGSEASVVDTALWLYCSTFLCRASQSFPHSQALRPPYLRFCPLNNLQDHLTQTRSTRTTVIEWSSHMTSNLMIALLNDQDSNSQLWS